MVAAEGYLRRLTLPESSGSSTLSATPGYRPSILVDVQAGRPTEGAHTIGDLVERAARRGVPAPLLTAALCSLQAHELTRLGQ